MMKIVVRVLLLLTLLSSTVEVHSVSMPFSGDGMQETSSCADRVMQLFSDKKKNSMNCAVASAVDNTKTAFNTYYDLNHKKIKANKVHYVDHVQGRAYKVVESKQSMFADEYVYCESVVDAGVGRLTGGALVGESEEYQRSSFAENSLLDESFYNPFVNSEEIAGNGCVSERNGPRKIGKEDESQLVTPDYRPPVGDSLLPLMVMILVFLFIRVIKIELT